MTTFTDHSELIDALGGAAKVAAAPDVATLPVNVRAWAARNRIPPEYWPGVILLAVEKNLPVTAEWLMQTTPPRRRPAQEAQAA
ncbi:carph-isopro domain-containing protein [Sphingomonas azotifigens]|uniref:carph-isopro domain-containing protein n=1 Tax=Sphingomonas azotifigens TaxID=330920 RepID=UPI00111C8B87|nr:hypothetical protein [Sphingomonas azotifigens]